MEEHDRKRWLLLRMDSRYGVGTTEQQWLRNDRLKAFRLCELSDVKPSESALPTSISHFFGGRSGTGSEPEAGGGR